MIYLISKIILFLLLASLLGVLIGWLLRHFQASSEKKRRAVQWNEQLARIERERDDLQGRIKGNESQLENLLQEQAEVAEEHRELVRINEESTGMIENLQHALQQEQNEARERLEGLQQQLESANSRAEELQQELQNAQAIRDEIESLRSEIDHTAAEMEQREEELRRISAMRDKERNNFEITISELDKYLSEAKNRTAQLQSELTESNERLQDNEEQMQGMGEIVVQQQEELDKNRAELTELRASLENLQNASIEQEQESEETELNDAQLAFAKGASRQLQAARTSGGKLQILMQQATEKIAELETINQQQSVEIAALNQLTVAEVSIDENEDSTDKNTTIQSLQQACLARDEKIRQLESNLAQFTAAGADSGITEQEKLNGSASFARDHQLMREAEGLKERLNEALFEKQALENKLDKFQETEQVLLKKYSDMASEVKKLEEKEATIEALSHETNVLKQQLKQVRFHADALREESIVKESNPIQRAK